MATTIERVQTLPSDPLKLRASAGFDWAMIVLCLWFQFGVYLDGWAHLRFSELETFFTPWHAVLYSGFLAASALLVATLVRNWAKGRPCRQRLPEGYGLSLLGVAIFMIGGVGDMAWHTLFGVEADVEALVSPTHLILALGGTLIYTGPLRAGWRRPSFAGQSWLARLPMVLSLALLLSIFTFFTVYAHPIGRPWPASGNQPTSALFPLASADPPVRGDSPPAIVVAQALGIAGALLQTALLMGIVVMALQRCRWELPKGTLTIVFTVNGALMAFMRDQAALVPGIVLTGLAGDILLACLRPSPVRPTALHLFAFAVPAIYYVLHFLTLALAKGVWWSIHLSAGVVVLAGVVGWLISYLAVPPAAESRS